MTVSRSTGAKSNQTQVLDRSHAKQRTMTAMKRSTSLMARRTHRYDAALEEGRSLMDTMKRMRGGAYSLGELIPHLGRSAKQLLHYRRKFQSIAYWCDAAGHFHYPKWQFDENWNVRPIVKSLLRILRSNDPGFIMSFFLLPADGLGGRSVLDTMRDSANAQILLNHARKCSVWMNH